MATGFTNSFTSGEISSDFDDRIDIQPVDKGCRQATNLMVTIAGPLKKRRGFWWNGDASNPAYQPRLIPFKHTVDDALMLEFADGAFRVWYANGSRVLESDGVTVFSAPSPYTAAELPGLRYCQVQDVIYFRHNSGLQPQSLTRITNTSWTWAVETWPNGPWLPENADQTAVLTLTSTSVASVIDATGGITPQAMAIKIGATVDLICTKPIFTPGMVGDSFRLRAGTGSASCRGWTPGENTPIGCFVVSVGNIYLAVADAGSGAKLNASNPPVQTQGIQSDGCSSFEYLHDGAGILTITAVNSPTTISGVVTATLPIGLNQATSYFSFAAYGGDVGWPRAWPCVVEERLVNAATASNLDMIDLTRIAGFTPTSEDYHPGQGTGNVVATDALRRRLGKGTGEILWTFPDTFLVAGSAEAEHVVSPGLFGEALTPSTIVCRVVSAFGSADVGPVGVHKGLCWVTRGGWSVRKMDVDLQQNATSSDLSFLAQHIRQRGFARMAWIPGPDENLWVKLADGGLAVLTMHDEQQVRGWTTQALPGGLGVDDLASLPGPGGFETLWIAVAREQDGVWQRWIMMQSQVSDSLFMDGATAFAGTAMTQVTLARFVNETVRVVVDGVMLTDREADVNGTVFLDGPVSNVVVGLAYQTQFASLKLDKQTLGGALLTRQRVNEVLVDLLCVTASVGMEGGRMEKQLGRRRGDIQNVTPRRMIEHVNTGGDSTRDPRLLVSEDSAYDFGIFALKPAVDVGS